MKTEEKIKCPYEKKCGGCKYQGIPYEKQLKEKEKKVRKLLKDYGKPEPIDPSEAISDPAIVTRQNTKAVSTHPFISLK